MMDVRRQCLGWVMWENSLRLTLSMISLMSKSACVTSCRKTFRDMAPVTERSALRLFAPRTFRPKTFRP